LGEGFGQHFVEEGNGGSAETFVCLHGEPTWNPSTASSSFTSMEAAMRKPGVLVATIEQFVHAR